MPRRGRRRRKSRTHVEQENTDSIAIVAKRGKLNINIKHLMTQLKLVLYPNTPLNFKESSKSSLKDLLSISKHYQVNTLVLFTQTGQNSYIRFCQVPEGPTVVFRILNYTLSTDIEKNNSQLQASFKAPPLLILKGVKGVVMQSLKNLFPSFSVGELSLGRCRRVVLFEKEGQNYYFRHYLIKTRVAGISRSLQKISANQIPNLNKFNSAYEWLDTENYESESEAEDLLGPSQKVSVRLLELGPRMQLQLHKIQKGFCGGEVIFHSYVIKGPDQIQQQEKKMKKKLKAQQEEKEVEIPKKRPLKKKENSKPPLVKKRKVN